MLDRWNNEIKMVSEASKRISDIFEGMSISEKEGEMLNFIKEKRSISISRFSNLLGVSYSRVTRISDSLVSKGLINREDGENDKRRVYLSLTFKGEEALKEYLERIRNFQDRLLKKFNTQELESIFSTLREYAEKVILAVEDKTEKKFRIAEKTESYIDHSTCFRIQALRDIPRWGVKAGDLGGWVNEEGNLSQDGDCWIMEDAVVRAGARVEGNALIKDRGKVGGSAVIGGEVIVEDEVEISGEVSILGRVFLSGGGGLK